MRRATNTPYQSDYGFRSPGFTVDLQGNIVANSISLASETVDNTIGDYEFTDNGIAFSVVGLDDTNPTINLARGESYTIELSLTNFVFDLLKADGTSYVDFNITHSSGDTGEDAQGKSSGLLNFTVPQNYTDDEIIYKARGTNVEGTFNVIDPVGLFSSITVTDITESSSPETGAIKVDGGIGLKKNLTVGGDLNVSNISAYNGNIVLTASDSTVIGTIDSSGSDIPIKNTTITNTAGSFTSASVTATPTEDNDITNKTYVDSTVSALAIALGA